MKKNTPRFANDICNLHARKIKKGFFEQRNTQLVIQLEKHYKKGKSTCEKQFHQFGFNRF